MPDATLSLSVDGAPLSVLPFGPGAELNLSLAGRLPQAVCGERVLRGARIAESLDPGQGDLHAPAAGTILAVSAEHVSLRVEGPDEAGSAVDVAALSGRELAAALKGLGLSLPGPRPAAVVVVGGLEAEPGLKTAQTLLRERNATLARGLDLARRLLEPRESVLIVGKGQTASLPGCRTLPVPARYPNGLAPLAVRAATGRENPDDAAFLSISELFALGQVAETGLPPTLAAVTAGISVHLARLGTPAGEILKAAGLTFANGDRLVLGGPFRGEALYSPAQGVDAGDAGLFVIPKDAYPPVTDSPCLNCGECVLVCPARIMPGMISRYAEFKLFERTLDYHVEACMDCGLCGYVCPGRRPVLQYIRLARRELAGLGPKATLNLENGETA